MLDLRSLVPFASRSGHPTRPETLDPFAQFRREMDQLFESFMGETPRLGRWYSGALMPRLDIHDEKDTLRIDVELPGVPEEDLDVKLDGDLLTISGEKKSQTEETKGERYLTERSYGSFRRSLRLPFTVDPDSVTAAFDKGVLTVRLPKPAEAEETARHIEIKPAA